MSDSVFLDTNLLIYYVSDDLPKKTRVHDLLITASSVTVSSQVIEGRLTIINPFKTD